MPSSARGTCDLLWLFLRKSGDQTRDLCKRAWRVLGRLTWWVGRLFESIVPERSPSGVGFSWDSIAVFCGLVAWSIPGVGFFIEKESRSPRALL